MPLPAALLLAAAASAGAQEPCPCPTDAKPPEPLWKAKVGLSYLATSGNSESTTAGVDLAAARRPEPWGLEVLASYDRAESADQLESERTFAALRGKRALGGRWDLFAEVTGERDEFAGFDLRAAITTGATAHVLTGPRHLLDVDLGLSWTEENRVGEEPDESYAGGRVGLTYQWKISERAAGGQRLNGYPNFETTGDWRLESATTLETAVTERLAIRFAYEVRYKNEPVGDRESTDTTTRLSLVVNF